MCFNVSLKLKKARMEERYNAIYPDELIVDPIYHTSAFEHPSLPVLTSEKPDKFNLMIWGLIPSWVKTEKDAIEISRTTANARAESITSKPSFRLIAKSNRCIIPISGFFEWQLVDNKKIPWFITLKNEDIISLAGLWSEWVNPQTGEIKKTFTILTTEANEMMAKIHNTKKRMPAILTRETEGIWLDKKTTTNEYPSIIKPLANNLLDAYTVSPLVSNARINRNVPEVIERYIYENTNQRELF